MHELNQKCHDSKCIDAGICQRLQVFERNNLLTMRKGERGGGRGTFLRGGWALAPTLGLAFMVPSVWLLPLPLPLLLSRSVVEGFEAEETVVAGAGAELGGGEGLRKEGRGIMPDVNNLIKMNMDLHLVNTGKPSPKTKHLVKTVAF